jgi:hypothetical protein
MSDLRWEYRVVKRPSVRYPGVWSYAIARVTYRADGTIHGWEEPQPLAGESLVTLAKLVNYMRPAMTHPVLVVTPDGLVPATGE